MSELKRNPSLKGKLVLEVTVGENGRVADIFVADNALNNAVANCIKGKNAIDSVSEARGRRSNLLVSLRLCLEWVVVQRLDRAGIEALLQTEQFKSWFAELSGLNHRLELLEAGIERAAEACAEASFRSSYWQEQAEEALLRSADLENTCHNLRIQIAQLENQAFDRLADFERVRDEVTELWVRITAIEHRCDDHPDEATRVRARARYQGELRSCVLNTQRGTSVKRRFGMRKN